MATKKTGAGAATSGTPLRLSKQTLKDLQAILREAASARQSKKVCVAAV